MLVTLILRGIVWATDAIIRINRVVVKPVYWLDAKAGRAWLRRQPNPPFTISDPEEVYDWAKDDRFKETCPVCESDEFPLTPYDGVRMCYACKDDAVISDRTVGGYADLKPVTDNTYNAAAEYVSAP